MTIQQLIEDYERRLKTSERMIDALNGSVFTDTKIAAQQFRLKVKAGMIRTFLSELKRVEK